MKSPLAGYYGGKHNLAPRIIQLIPDLSKSMYIEPFAGGASVFWQLEPKYATLNDTNDLIVAFYKCLKDPGLREKLIHELEYTPYSRSYYNEMRKTTPETMLEKAVYLWVGIQMSFGGDLWHSWGFKIGGGSPKPQEFRNAIKNIDRVKQLLDTCQIECIDAIECIRKYDNKDNFFYVDPPYIGTDQGRYKGYTEENYKELLETLTKIEGKFILSSYSNEILDTYIENNSWQTQSISTLCRAAPSNNGAQRSKRTEVLTYNYSPNAQISIF